MSADAPTKKQRVLNEVLQERQRQDAKWGEQNHGLPVWLAVLGEEYGEVCQAVLKGRATAMPSSPDHTTLTPEEWVSHIRKELIQTAAVAVQAVEYLDRTSARRALGISEVRASGSEGGANADA